MDPHRKFWNEQHQRLNRLLAKGDRDAAIPLFLDQHAMVHSSKVSRSRLWSFEDELLEGLTDDQIRQIPPGGEHSIAWILFHLARIEDIVMNLLVAGTPQLFTSQDWGNRMNVPVLHSANKMDEQSIEQLSLGMDVRCLRDYRLAAARRTRQVVRKLKAEDLRKKVDPGRIENVLREGAVLPEAMEILHYWSKKTVAGLLLMPPTRHCILHLNEGMRVREGIRE